MKSEISKISDEKLLRMIQGATLKDVASYFKVHQSYISERITKALKNRDIGVKTIPESILSEVDLGDYSGAWMESKERAYFLKYMKPEFDKKAGDWRKQYKKLTLKS